MSRYAKALQPYVNGRWFQMPYDFLNTLRPGEAILLAYVVNVVGMEIDRRETDDPRNEDRWVRLSTPKIRARLLSYTERKIERALASLKQKKIIQTKVIGDPPTKRRYVYVDVHRLEAWMQTTLTRLGTNKNVGTSYEGAVPTKMSVPGTDKNQPTPIYIVRKNSLKKNFVSTEVETGTTSTQNTTHCKDCKDVDWIKIAMRLKDAIEKVRKINKKSRPDLWHHDFRRIHEVDEISQARLEEILTWYCKMLKVDLIRHNPDYLPIAYTGGEFRRGFDKLERAMDRIQSKNSAGKIKKPKRKLPMFINGRRMTEDELPSPY